MVSKYYNGKLYLMWNVPDNADDETPNPGLYHNFRVGSRAGRGDIVPARYGSPLLGSYLTKVTTSTVRDTDIDEGNIDVSSYRYIRVLNVSGSGYYWAVQTIDTGLGYSWAEGYDEERWSEESVFIDETPPEGYPSPPVPAAGEYTYDTEIEFELDKGSSRDPETGIYGCYIQVRETDPQGNSAVVFEGELSEELTEEVWDSQGKGSFTFEGRFDHSYSARIKARHGYDTNVPTSTYLAGKPPGITEEEWKWDYRSPHYTGEGPYEGWSQWGDGVAVIELVSISRNLLRGGGDEVEVNYHLGASGRVSIRVYDKMGGLVKTLINRTLEPGSESPVRWDGTCSGGSAVSSGLYFLNIQVPGGDETLKIVVVR